MKLPLESITVGKRRREDYGDINGLAESMRRFGLLHPVVVDDEANLVAGGRRLRAAQMLGWESIEVRDLGELSEAERDEIELEENARRKDLTPYERSKTLVKLAETAQRVLKEQAEDVAEFRSNAERNSAGRPKETASIRAVAERILADMKKEATLIAGLAYIRLGDENRAKGQRLVRVWQEMDDRGLSDDDTVRSLYSA